MSFPKLLKTELKDLILIEPNVERDAETSLKWLSGNNGIDTMQLMGVPKDKITIPSIENERARIKDFLEREDQLNWAISYTGIVVGATWVDLVENNHVPPPSVHIMIGDNTFRGKGIGHATIKALLDYLIDELSFGTIYSRHLSHNIPIAKVFNSLGFIDDGNLYKDEDGLVWQNVVLSSREQRRD